MSLLMRNEPVATRFGGGFVQSIDGLSGGQEGARPVDWFYYVNGIEAGRGAADTNVHAGDHIWWDRHDWSQTEHVPAVVGSFPEPFLNGVEGKRLPVRVECSTVPAPACHTVAARLRSQPCGRNLNTVSVRRKLKLLAFTAGSDPPGGFKDNAAAHLELAFQPQPFGDGIIIRGLARSWRPAGP